MAADRFLSDGKYETNLSYCAVCVHKYANSPSCVAFPSRIPDVFLSGEMNHTAAYPGDNGIRFEPIQNKLAVGEVVNNGGN